MYSPETGRFLTKDSWRGDYNRPTSLNRWSYVEGSPINHSDPSGHSIGCMSLVFSYGTIPSGISASQLISKCREFYTPHYWANNHVFNCNELNSSVWSKPQTVGELFEDYICERGPERVEFSAGDNLTKQLEYSILLDRIRREFYKGGVNYPKELKFNPLEFLMALNDVYAANIIHSPDFPLTHFLGSFNYTVTSTNIGRVKITIDNRTDLASGTHFPGVFPPEGEGAFPLSLEKVIREGPPELAHMQAWDLILNYRDPEGRRIVSVLPPLTRSQTMGGMGGGAMSEVFTWTEANLSCEIQKLPWPFYLPLLNIQ